MELLPACHPYIKKADNTPDYHLIVAAAYSAIIKNPDINITVDCLMERLSAAKIIPDNLSFNFTDYNEYSCFNIAQTFHCAFICYLCPLSTFYKNANEEKELAVLSLALHSWDDLQYVKTLVDSRFFQAQYLINPHPEKCVPTLPLNRLAFEYLAAAVNQQTPFKNIPGAIADILLKKNHDKLIPDNHSMIRDYLSNLQKNAKNISRNNVANLLNIKNYQKSPADITPGSSSKISKSEDSIMEGSCLEGLLANSPMPNSLSNNQHPGNRPKKVINTPKPSMIPPNSQPDNCSLDKTKVMVSKPEQLSSEKKTTDSQALPLNVFNMEASVKAGFFIKKISDSSKAPHKMEFEEFLLLNPELSAEIVTNAQQQHPMLLLYGSGIFYYIDLNEEDIFNILCMYIGKSNRRRLLCYEPYRLIYYLHKLYIPYNSVTSLKTLYITMAQLKKKQLPQNSSGLIKELFPLSAKTPTPFLPYIMSLYRQSWQSLTKQKVYEDNLAAFSDAAKFDSILGISYYINADPPLPLFHTAQKMIFSYEKGMVLLNNSYAVEYCFDMKQMVDDCFVIKLLLSLSDHKIFENYNSRLLLYTTNSIIIATDAKNHANLSEMIFYLATNIGEELDYSPVSIHEITINGKPSRQ